MPWGLASAVREMPDLLGKYRVTDMSLAAQLADAHRLSWWEDGCAEVLNAHSALSTMFDRIDVPWSRRLVGSTRALGPLARTALLSGKQMGLLGISGLLRAPDSAS